MNNLASIIEYMLLSRNCVIVPSLGAFYAEHTPSRSVLSEDVFLPPVRHIHFDASLNEDPEEFFIRSFAELCQCDKVSARKRFDEMISNFHRRLISDGTFDFGSIGVFSLEEDAEITLAPCECGVITPAYYGLDTLHFPSLNIEDYEAEVTKTIMEIIPENRQVVENNSNTTSETSDCQSACTKTCENHYIIRLNKSAVHYALAVASTIALFFIMRPVTIKTSEQNQQECAVMFLQPEMVHEVSKVEFDQENDSLLNKSLVDSLVNVNEDLEFDGVLVDVTQVNNEEYVFSTETTSLNNTSKLNKEESNKKIPNKSSNTTSEKITNSDNSVHFYIVMASGVAKENAEIYVTKLAKEGIKANIIEGELRRVVIDGFSSYESARQRLNEIKASGCCPDAWILKL